MPSMIGFTDVAEEPITSIIEVIPEPHSAGDNIELFGLGLDAKIVSPQFERLDLRVLQPRKHSAIAGTCSVNVIVETPFQVIHHGLDVKLLESGVDLATDVRL